MTNAPLRLLTLGRTVLLGPGGAPVSTIRRKDLALLVYLVLEGRRPLARGTLAGLLWGEADEERARHSLTQALVRLKAVVGSEAFGSGGEALVWSGDVGCDAADLEATDPTGAPPSSPIAYPGDFATDLALGAGAEDFDAWADGKRAHSRALAVRRLDAAGARAESAGSWGEALELGRQLVGVDRLCESGHRRIMRSWSALGERQMAARHYDEYASWLEQEVGAKPDPETRSMHEAIVASGLAGRAASSWTGPAWLERADPPGPGTAGVESASGDSGRAHTPPGRPGSLQIFSWAAAAFTVGVLTVVTLRSVWPRSVVAGEGSVAARERIVFSSDRSGRARLYSMSLAGGPATLLPDEPSSGVFPSPDGRLRARPRVARGRIELEVSDAGSGEVLGSFRDSREDDFKAWAPDGSRLLFASYRAGNADLYSARPDGRDVRQLTSDPADEDAACWSPDGSAIAFRSRRAGTRELWLMDADGGRPRRLVKGLQPAECAFSPDGLSVAFTDRLTGRSDLWLVGRDGSHPRRLAERTAYTHWSADGQWIVFGTDRDGDREVYRIRADGTDEQNLTRNEAQDFPVSVSGTLPPRYVDRVRLEPAPGVPMVIGEHRTLAARSYDARGRYVYGIPLRWESSDTAILAVDSTGTVVARALGRATVTASAGGWRADTVSVAVAPGKPALVLSDDFEGGLDPRRWRVFGQPRPYVARGLGTNGSAAFVSNGDDYYESGVLSREFPLARGLSVEFSACAPLTAAPHQVLEVDIATIDADAAQLERGEIFVRGTEQLADFSIYAHGTDAAPWIKFGGLRFPAPVATADWHGYTIVLRPDRWRELYIDGRPVALAEPWTGPHASATASVVLGYRSLGTRLVQDDVRVYEGLAAFPSAPFPITIETVTP